MSTLYIKYPSPTAGAVTSINGLTGAITLAAGSGITITPSGNTLTIAATGSPSFPLLAPDGSNSNPSYSFTNSTNSGFYLSGTNQIGFSANGTNVGHYDTTSWTLARNQIVIGDGTSAQAPFFGVNGTNDGSLTIAGSSSSSLGGVIALTGSTNATPNLILFNTAGTQAGFFDAAQSLNLNVGLRVGTSTSFATEQITVQNVPSSDSTAATNIATNWLRQNNAAVTANTIGGLFQGSRTITTSETDTQRYVLVYGASALNISSGQTYTHSGTANNSWAGFRYDWPGIAGGGTSAISQIQGIYMTSSSVNLGTGKAGIVMGAISGATNNAGIVIGQTTIPVGQFGYYSGSSNDNSYAGNVVISAAGKGLQVKEGSNAKQGTATLTAGTVTVSNTSVTANSRIFLTAQSLGTVSVPSALAVTARSAGTSFTITASAPTDTSVVAYQIFEPA